MIELKLVKKTYNEGRQNEFTAVDDINLTIERGAVTVLKGPSGSGKTTLLSLVGGMQRPTAGRIFIDGREITSLPERFLAELRRKQFGFIFQQLHLIRGLSVIENVMLPAYPAGEARKALEARAKQLLGMLDISEKERSPVEWLSGGESQRAAIARALMNNPSIIIADEPTAHLDTALSREFMEIMARLNSEGKTVIIASHDPVVFDSLIAHRVVSLRDGRLVI